MERITISVEQLRIHSLLRNESRGLTWFSLDFGDALALNNLYVKDEGDGEYHWNDAAGNFRFLDVAAMHHGEPGGEPGFNDCLLLESLVAAAVSQQISQLLPFARGEVDDLELLSWKPWEGKSLKIPVDFVLVRNLRDTYPQHNQLIADVQLGRHLVLWEVQLSDKRQFFPDQSRIREERILQTILGIEGLTETVNSFCATGTVDCSAEFLVAGPGCDIHAAPPPVWIE